MQDLGDPTSYLELPEGVDVFAADGEKVGRVSSVVSDPVADIFEGLIIGGDRFVEAAQIKSMHERGVVLAIDAAAADRLEPPEERSPNL